MILESKYQLWQIDKTVTVNIRMGLVDFNNMIVEKVNKKENSYRALKIKRKKANDDRVRPDSGKSRY